MPMAPKRLIPIRITPADIRADEQRVRAARNLLFQAWMAECRDG